jgi:membrane-associated phospholipid phosphatase
MINIISKLLSLISLFVSLLLIIGLFFSNFLHLILKSITTDLEPHNIFKRPVGANDCSLFNNGGLVEHESGFPSGHVTSVSFVMNYLYYQSSNNIKNNFIFNIPTILVAIGRYMGNCHNIIQIIAGYLLGFSIAYLMIKYNTFLKTLMNKL